MSIEEAYKEILKRLKKDSKKDIKAFARKMRMPYNTVKCLVKEESLGTIRTWLKVERFFARQDKTT